MTRPRPRDPMRDKLLFTPGPLTTSATVKAAMQRDVGSRDAEFIALVRSIRERLLVLAGVSQEDGYEAVLVQGSGTFGIEAVISTAIVVVPWWSVVPVMSAIGALAVNALLIAFALVPAWNETLAH